LIARSSRPGIPTTSQKNILTRIIRITPTISYTAWGVIAWTSSTIIKL